MNNFDPGLQLLLRALSQYGQAESPGSACCAAIAEFLESVGLNPSDETAWCSAFLYWCAEKEGLIRPKKGIAAAAKSWLRIGDPVTAPTLGDIVIIGRGDAASWTGHVGIFIAYSAHGEIYVLGGNQGNSVTIAPFPLTRVLGYRRIPPIALAPNVDNRDRTI